jgi:GH15 family glucan-1,4-alpha-glucosidase
MLPDPAPGIALRSPYLNASLLLLRMVGLLPTPDPGMVGSGHAIELRRLMRRFMPRYNTE